MSRYVPYRTRLVPRARRLRRDATLAERKLWHEFLRSLPEKFTRQKPLGCYIVDFYCASKRVAIEIDGDSHDSEAERYDECRTLALGQLGVRIVRFTNEELFNNFDGVCGKILEAPLPVGQDECAACVSEAASPPSTWTLFRLWRFAKPYKRRLLAGFLLTLGSTGATLVPPYLTMPLMDNVLIPYQNGKPIDVDLVRFYLTGLLGAALLAWVLGWSRTYMLARVSERTGAG